jgi:hypothetical protein
MTDGRWSCSGCGRKVSVTAGTIFDRSRIPLQQWFAAAWYMTNQKHGVSALGLQRLLGLGSYQTAWTILQKLRTAMVRPGRDRLCGPVEADETYVGGIAQGIRGRGADCKFIVAVAIEVLSPKGFGRVRLQHVNDVSGASLVPFVSGAVEPGSEVRRMEGLQRAIPSRVQTPRDQHLRKRRPSPCFHARGAQGGFPPQTLAARNTPGIGDRGASGCLSQ